MAIAILFDIPGATRQQYDAVIPKLEAAEQEAQEGRLYHVSGPTQDGWHVLDVWHSQE